MTDHVARMLTEARGRLHDAGILAKSLQSVSDSAALMRILALEVLLKAALQAAGTPYKRNHDYPALWADLSPQVQNLVWQTGELLDPGRLSPEAIPEHLKNWEFIFKKARYFYELHEKHSLAEQAALGEQWLARGAIEGEAEVRYQPFELRAPSLPASWRTWTM